MTAFAASMADPEVWHRTWRSTAFIDPFDSWQADDELVEKIMGLDLDDGLPPDLPSRDEVLAVLS